MEVVGLYDKITNQLLDLLDIAVNANSLLISFDINENVRDLEGFLKEQLKSGVFQDRMIHQDMVREWYNYWEMNDKGRYQVAKGPLWNGRSPIIQTLLTQQEFKNLLYQLLTATGIFASPPSYCQPVAPAIAKSTLADWINLLYKKLKQWTVSQWSPDFLYDMYIEPGRNDHLSYFSGTKRDLVFVLASENLVAVLLINGGS